MKKIKKKKAFIGAIINGVGAIAGAIGQGIKAKKDAELQEQQYRNQQGLIYKQEAQQLANVLTQEANSQDYVQQMKNRVTLNRLGGEHKTKKIKKKKAFLGIANAIGDSIGGAINMIGALTNTPKDYTLQHNDPIKSIAPKVIKDPNQAAQQTALAMQQAYTNPYNQNINPVLNQARLGTKRVVKKNLNRFK